MTCRAMWPLPPPVPYDPLLKAYLEHKDVALRQTIVCLNTDIAAAGVAVPVSIANGGTGATNAADARTNLGLGTLAVLNSPVPIANGGTGQTTKTDAFDALSPLSSKGDILTHDGSDNVVLVVGAEGQVLSVGAGTVPAWTTPTLSWSFMFGVRPINSTAASLAVADASLADITDMDGYVAGRNMADSARTDLAWWFFVPDELDVTKVVTAKVFYRLAAAGTGAAVEIEITGRIIADNEVCVSGGTQVDVAAAKNIDGYASGDLVVHALGTVFAANALAADRYVKGTVFRDAQAGNADDTFANTVNMIGIKFTGTRKP